MLILVDFMIFETQPQTWQELQDYVGQMFRECGFNVEVSKVLPNVRGKKEIDVFVQDLNSEYRPTILVECKFYKGKVSQEKAHAFRTVMQDYGANLGFIVAPNGFQKGCHEVVANTNVRLVSLDELQVEYFEKWINAMVGRYMPIADALFPYWDHVGGKIHAKGIPLDFDKHQLLNRAYNPICSLGPGDQTVFGFRRWNCF
ncbi:MAG: restriction endonuclease [Chryseobacterium sp.]|nr:MAG: restriction endonuclease [Chryseobacterium sp.]